MANFVPPGDLHLHRSEPGRGGDRDGSRVQAHTSIKERVAHVQAQGRTEDLNASRDGSAAGSAAAAGLEESHWLCPIEDRRRLDSAREGMVEGFSLGSYLQLVDYTARLYRAGKAAVSREVAAILDRLGSTADQWQARLEKLRQGRFLGREYPPKSLRPPDSTQAERERPGRRHTRKPSACMIGISSQDRANWDCD